MLHKRLDDMKRTVHPYPSMSDTAPEPADLTRWQRFTDQWCGWSAITLIFAAPISRTLFIVAGLLFALGWFVEGNFRSKARILWAQPITAPLILLTGIVLIWSPFSPASGPEVINTLKVYSKLPLVLMIVTTLSHDRWRHRAWLAFTLAMVIVVLSTYANVVVDLPWSKTKNQGIGQDHSVFIEHVSQSIMTTVAIAMALQRAMASTLWKVRLAWSMWAAVALVSALFLLQGRSGLVAMVLVAFVFVYLYTPHARRLPVAAVVGLAGVILLASSPLVRDRLQLGYSEIVNYQPFEKTSLGARIDMWRFALDRTLEHPLLGNGAGTYHQMASEYFGHCIWVCTHPHSQYLYFSVEYGISALLAFLWFLWRIRLTAHLSTQAERSILYAFLAIIAVDSIFNVPFWWRGQSYFTYAMLGLLIASNLQVRGSTFRACEQRA